MPNPMQWWSDFLTARAAAMKALFDEGKTLAEIVEQLNLRPGQAQSILATQTGVVVPMSDSMKIEQLLDSAATPKVYVPFNPFKATRTALALMTGEQRVAFVESITAGYCRYCGDGKGDEDDGNRCHGQCDNDE